MTQDEIIAMARDADLICEFSPVIAWMESTDLTPYLTRFAALVAAHEREKFLNKLDGVSEKVIYETVKEAVLAEREACAKECDYWAKQAEERGYTCKGETHIDGFGDGAASCAAALRERGETK